MLTQVKLWPYIRLLRQRTTRIVRRVYAFPQIRRILRLAGYTLLTLYFAFSLLFLGVRHLVLPYITQYRAEVENMLGNRLGRQVSISSLHASWHGFYPLLKLKDLKIHDQEGDVALQLPDVSVALSWWSFVLLDVRFAQVEINSPTLDVRRDEAGQWWVAGLRVDKDSAGQEGGLDWILRQDNITVRDGTLLWQDALRNEATLRLSQLELAMANHGRRHHVRLLARSDITPDEPIDVRVDFRHAFWANRISDPMEWEGEAYISLPESDLLAWGAYVDIPPELQNASGSLHAWISFGEGRFADLTMDMDVKALALRLAPELPTLRLDALRGRVSASITRTGTLSAMRLADSPHTIALSDLSFRTETGLSADKLSFSRKFTPAQGDRAAETEITASNLELATLVRLSRCFPLPETIRDLLLARAPTGRIPALSLLWEGDISHPTAYNLTGQFQSLTVEPAPARRTPSTSLDNMPGFSNMSGYVSANQYGGTLSLEAAQAGLKAPAYFPVAEWLFDQLRARVSWVLSEKTGISFSVEDLTLLLNGMTFSASGQYTHATPDAADTRNTIDMSVNAQNVNMSRIRHYVPTHTPARLREWLTKAFEQGTVSTLTAQLRGNLSEFPFEDAHGNAGDGLFLVQATIRDATLNYAPAPPARETRQSLWPRIEKINGTFAMQGRRIAIHADDALLTGVSLSDVDVVIPDMLSDAPVLDIVGRASGELQDFVHFVNISPVSGVVGGLLEEAQTTGTASLLLKMGLPMKKMSDSRVQGTLDLQNNAVRLFHALPLLSNASGKVHFSDKGFELEKMTAHFLGDKVEIAGKTQKNGEFQVTAAGRLNAEGLRKAYPGGAMSRLLRHVSGSTPYSVAITKNGAYPDVLVESSLRGFAVDLPEPLGKKADENRPLRVLVQNRSDHTRRDAIQIAYGKTVNAYYERKKTARGWQILKGGIGIHAEPDPQPGISLTLRMDSLDTNAWRTVLEPLATSSPSEAGANTGAESYVDPQTLSLHVGKLPLLHTALSHVDMTILRQAGRMQIRLQSDEARGDITWIAPSARHPSGRVRAHCSVLTIASEAGVLKEAAQKNKIRQIPTLDITVNELSLFGKKLGKLALTGNPLEGKEGWQIRQLSISNSAAQLQATGGWMLDDRGAPRT
ncbi:MAG: hypothetical protein LBK01_03240, partial [Burkholderiaceae bacterium]|nr:hypothetical protein [Burkholderiaceae bacterium]